MKKIIIAIGVIVAVVGMFITYSAKGKDPNQGNRVKTSVPATGLSRDGNMSNA